MIPRRFPLVIACAIAFALIAGDAYAAKGFTVQSLRAFQAWVEAVRTHTPGKKDDAVDKVSSYSFETRQDLDAGMAFFISVVFSHHYDTRDNEALRLLADLARLARGNPDAQTFIKRAVLLHSDAAMFGDRYEEVASKNDDAGRPHLRVDPNSGLPVNLDDQTRVHPLTTQRGIYTDKDGQVLGNSLASWQWPFARWLLDYLLRDVAATGPCHGAQCFGGSASLAEGKDESFIASWYHATTAFMFARGLYAEATTHIQRAGEVLPDDPRILFDRACYSEILGLPMHQVLLPDETDAERELHRTGGVGWRRADEATMGIPKLSVTNGEAERLFRHALKVDPNYIEARVRLGRLLTVRKKYDEAAAELATALAAKSSDAVVAFYADLFAGRAAMWLGRHEEAAQRYRDALANFPDAQSALLGLSNAGLLSASVSAALEPVQQLGEKTAAQNADPWWYYHLGAGRSFEALLDTVWDMVPAKEHLH